MAINTSYTKAFIRCYKKTSIMKLIKGSLFYAYIKHDKETDEKKDHYHLVVEWKSSKRLSTINSIDKDDNFNVLKWLNGAIDYLTHKNHKDKKQYPLSEIISSSPIDLLIDIEKKSVAERKDEALKTAIDYVLGKITFRQLLNEAPTLIYSIGNIQKAKELLHIEELQRLSENGDWLVDESLRKEVKS